VLEASHRGRPLAAEEQAACRPRDFRTNLGEGLAFAAAPVSPYAFPTAMLGAPTRLGSLVGY